MLCQLSWLNSYIRYRSCVLPLLDRNTTESMKVLIAKSSDRAQPSSFTARRSQLVFILGICFVSAFASVADAKRQAGEPPNTTVDATYKIDDLGELAAIADDVTVSLNNTGAVAYWTRTNGTVRATIWRNGHAKAIEEVPRYPNTIAHTVDRNGDIAGWMNTSGNPVDSLSTTQGFVRHGKRIRIVPGLGGRDSRVLGLNDKGAAVGVASLADGASHAFLFAGSNIADLGTLPSGTSSTAYAINNAGLVAGAADVDGKINHAVLWVNRKIVDLGALPHGATSSARAINSHGQIVGFSDTPDGVHAFLFAEGAMRDLGTLGSDPSEASGINNRGDVVGASNLSSTKRRAFLWSEGRMMDVNTFLPVGSSWVLLNAFSINDRGQIVCSGRRKGESTHLLLLTPQ